ncbi:hypothetical protein Q0Z83_069420 [Actinoplanes sichuanensis]|uniref:DUF4179 domain-containing protein n=1 Tax=Actinoplanes sichuanensis TaxID=512349 RepID=A0ABW4ABR4_9ACTN|nr:hypothetical protein [Actinoplanes sichuanensis]BEL08751.1 hypothetical protein Q0Z83_069420 [Actinoplanes sichuanensis]
MNRDRLPSTLLSANPVSGAEPGDGDRLAAIRAAVDTRRSMTAAPLHARAGLLRTLFAGPRRGRRLALLAGLTVVAVSVPLGLAVVGPGMHERGEDRLVTAAVAADGTLTCSGLHEGYAEPIRPDRSKVRLFPTVVPAGWQLVDVFARDSTGPAACITPSLVAGELDGQGVMRGGVWVNGPVDRISFDEDGVQSVPAPVRVDDVLNGRPAVRYEFRREDTVDYSWIWSDDRGKHWQASVAGYPLERARELMAAVGTDGSQVVWTAARAPGLRVLHQRTGQPYPAKTSFENWYIRFMADGRERTISVESDRLLPLAAELRPGLRLGELAGHPEIDFSGQIYYEPPQAGTRAIAEVEDDADDVRAILAGLRQLSPDDPLLDRYALRE